jgi:hypothetical protein
MLEYILLREPAFAPNATNEPNATTKPKYLIFIFISPFQG